MEGSNYCAIPSERKTLSQSQSSDGDKDNDNNNNDDEGFIYVSAEVGSVWVRVGGRRRGWLRGVTLLRRVA